MLMCFVVSQAALAHLESLAIDVEQAHPPATEQIIDCLPQITMHAENIGNTHNTSVSKCLIVFKQYYQRGKDLF